MSEKKKQTAQEVITRIWTPFTLGDLRDFVAALADRPDSEGLELKAGSGMFQPSSLTHRRKADPPTPTDRLVGAVRDSERPTVIAADTKDAMAEAWGYASTLPDYLVLLQYPTDAQAKRAFAKYRGTACKWEGVQHIVSGSQGGSILLENGSAIRFGALLIQPGAGNWDLILKVTGTP